MMISKKIINNVVIAASVIVLSLLVVLCFVFFTMLAEDVSISFYELISEKWIMIFIFRIGFYFFPITVVYVYLSVRKKYSIKFNIHSFLKITKFVFGIYLFINFLWHFLSLDIVFPNFIFSNWAESIAGVGGFLISYLLEKHYSNDNSVTDYKSQNIINNQDELINSKYLFLLIIGYMFVRIAPEIFDIEDGIFIAIFESLGGVVNILALFLVAVQIHSSNKQLEIMKKQDDRSLKSELRLKAIGKESAIYKLTLYNLGNGHVFDVNVKAYFVHEDIKTNLNTILVLDKEIKKEGTNRTQVFTHSFKNEIIKSEESIELYLKWNQLFEQTELFFEFTFMDKSFDELQTRIITVPEPTPIVFD